MKYLAFLLFIALTFCTISCDKDEANSDLEDDMVVNTDIIGTWNATTTSGGFAGISCVYQPGELVLVFDSDNNLTVTNNVLNTTATCGGQEIGVSVGTHKYSILNVEAPDLGDKKYLVVDEVELGEIMLTTNEFTLDQNNSSQGSGADLYILNFAK